MDDPQYGNELFRIPAPGASAQGLLQGSGAGMTSLEVGPPVLGQSFSVAGSGPTGHVGVVLFSIPSARALPIPGAAFLGLDASTLQILSPVAGSSFSWLFAVPTSPSLDGVQFQLQALWANSISFTPFASSRAVRLRVGQ
jgi:hypothetical protein